MKLKTLKIIQNALWGLTFLCLFFTYILDNGIFAYISIAFVAVIVTVRIVFWKCPHCGKLLGRNTKYFCSYCGKKLP